MAEAGLLLSVVSLTFQVFSGCVKGYQLITDAKHMPSDCQYLRVRLKTEQYRLLDWAEIVNLDEQDDKLLISNSSKGLLLDVLDQQRRLLHQFGRLDDKYKKLSKPLLVDEIEATGDLPNPPPYSPTEEKSPTIQRQDTDFANRFPQAESLLKKSLEFAQKSGQFPRKFKWATFDRAKFENLVLKLTSFNDFMSDMLNHNQLKALAIKQTRTEFQIMQLNSSIVNLVQIFEAAVLAKKHERKKSRFSDNTVRAYMQARGLDDADDELDMAKPDLHNLAALAQFKALNSAMEDSKILDDDFTTSFDLKHTASEIRSVELRRTDIKIMDTEGDDFGESQRVEGMYQPPRSRKTSVWIEWKTYDPPTFHSSGPDSKILERVQKLAALLKENNSTEFRAPHCLGYFNDIDLESGEPHCRFGLVFEKPSSAHPLTRPVSLHSLLTSAEVDMPSLTDRITLMQHLSETLERLHAVNWLHKGLRSSNILFFSDSGPNEISYAEPYLSGFDYSRPAMNDDMTEKPPENAREDIYRHPRVQGSGNRDTSSGVGGYKKSYDIYSLGVILLEIAYWKPIEQILEIKDLQNARPSVTIKARTRLLDEKEGILRFVKSHLGTRVEGVVKACLEGPGAFGLKDGLNEKTEAGGAQLGKGFYREVVQVLGDMRI